ncbi:uncharacterized protein LOC132204862 isoform X2 [Neocloeon triangulifer]|uniref:uncharacterized protein LOC132204862 isoform X2 n=1 Tax=Neocloeon triangulifer TaxID=2078957 RepID=UPI00286F1B13|nr:uncharacterized protein LOC132204862 isoform X2 [Neocloeon triangulifer]
MDRLLRLLLGLLAILIPVLTTNPTNNYQSTKAQEREKLAEFQQELTKNVKETNDKLNDLAKLVDERFNQTMQKATTNQELLQIVIQKLNHLAQIPDNELGKIKKFHVPINCTLPRLSTMTTATNGKKYFFSYPTEAFWAVANESCAERGLLLATVSNQIDLDAVHQKAREIKRGDEWWVSAKNLGGESQLDYRWHDGSKLEQSSALWANGTVKNRGCVEIRTYEFSKLYSASCSTEKSHYICELPTECY